MKRLLQLTIWTSITFGGIAFGSVLDRTGEPVLPRELQGSIMLGPERSMNGGWPFSNLLGYECDRSIELRGDRRFACELRKNYLFIYVYDRLESDKAKQTEALYHINTVIAQYVLAGGTRVLFVDMTNGPAEQIRSCRYERKGRSACTVWTVLTDFYVKLYGLGALVD
ncbi:MAG: hypothetical protein F4090_05000 [Nitrospira sp. SB0672_bin_25]|nr:hypothetical protein [Nitrospira sp. SB0666_bin_27]MYF24255.1 hypothetical protein [Nitrospira sp. SB0678_bin_10]MYJ54251.1 hypothetical protein [Nitrospira sp. SB0672_bin_25]